MSNMKSYEIFLKSIIDVKNFVNLMNSYSFEVDLVSGRYVVDAKSIMGIFSLDLSKPIMLRAYTEDAAALEQLERDIAPMAN